MIIDKLYWKTLYYWIRYLNYDLLSSEKENNEIWLVHKRKKSVVVLEEMLLPHKKSDLISLKLKRILTN